MVINVWPTYVRVSRDEAPRPLCCAAVCSLRQQEAAWRGRAGSCRRSRRPRESRTMPVFYHLLAVFKRQEAGRPCCAAAAAAPSSPPLQGSSQAASDINNPGLFYLVSAPSTSPLPSNSLSAHKHLSSTPPLHTHTHTRQHPAEL